jgi:hypothetical protein
MSVKVDGPPANIRVDAPPGEMVVTPDPLARVKRICRWGWPLAAGLVVGLAILGLALHKSIQWGDFPTWVMAVTTLLALLAAAFAGLVAYDVLQIEAARDLKAAEARLQADADRRQSDKDRWRAELDRAEDRRAADNEKAAQREADHRAQAGKVTAWFAWFQIDIDGEAASEGSFIMSGTAGWGGAVSNASDLPIFDVRLFYFRVEDPKDGTTWTAVHVYASVHIIRVIPPGRARNQVLPSRVRDMYEGCDDQLYMVGVEFTDANGQRWYRNERAVLEPRP